MAKEDLSARERALLAEARREAAAHKASPPLAAPARAPEPAALKARPAPTAAERLAQLMADERAQSVEKKKKMRRYGLTIAAGILALFALWLARVFRRTR
jgi:hypothetical protein